MIDWVYVLTPLLVLPIVLLFRFVGCGLDVVGQLDDVPLPERAHNPPPYRDYLMTAFGIPPAGDVLFPKAVPDRDKIVGYWRLVDAAVTTAADEKNNHPGTYVTVAAQVSEPGTDAGPGAGLVAFAPPPTSLIASQPSALGHLFRGGCVQVPDPPGGALHLTDFTIEAWVKPSASLTAGTSIEHTIFSAGDPLAAEAPTGFSVFLDATHTLRVRLAPAGLLALSQGPPKFSPGGVYYLALIVDTDAGQKRTRLFVNFLSTLVPAGEFKSASYTPAAAGTPLTIGAATRAGVGGGTQIYRPFIGQIQEVVLHNVALPTEQLANHIDINRANS